MFTENIYFELNQFFLVHCYSFIHSFIFTQFILNIVCQWGKKNKLNDNKIIQNIIIFFNFIYSTFIENSNKATILRIKELNMKGVTDFSVESNFVEICRAFVEFLQA